MAIFLSRLKDERTEMATRFLAETLGHGIEKTNGVTDDDAWISQCRLALKRADMLIFERDASERVRDRMPESPS